MERGTRIQVKREHLSDVKRGIFIRKVRHNDTYYGISSVQMGVVLFDDRSNTTSVILSEILPEEMMPNKREVTAKKVAKELAKRKRRGKCLCPTCGAVRHSEDQTTVLDYIFATHESAARNGAVKYLNFQSWLRVVARNEQAKEAPDASETE